MLLILTLLSVSLAYACDKEHHYRHHDRHLERRDTSPVFPPILATNEEILVSSFDNTSIASWSSYYCKNRLPAVRVSENAYQAAQHTNATSRAKVMQFRNGLQNDGLNMALTQG